VFSIQNAHSTYASHNKRYFWSWALNTEHGILNTDWYQYLFISGRLSISCYQIYFYRRNTKSQFKNPLITDDWSLTTKMSVFSSGIRKQGTGIRKFSWSLISETWYLKCLSLHNVKELFPVFSNQWSVIRSLLTLKHLHFILRIFCVLSIEY